MQQAEPSPTQKSLRCGRCGGDLPGGPARHPVMVAFSVVVAAALLWVAFAEPVFDMYLAGRYASASLLSGPRMLVTRGLPELAFVVFVTLLIAPLAHLLILGMSLVGSRMRSPPRILFMPLGLAETARHWAMGDVYLLGALVCYVRLDAWGHLHVGDAVAALVALRLVTLAAELVLDPTALWQRMPWSFPEARAPRAGASYLACSWCTLVSRSVPRQPCPRCGRDLSARKKNSLPRTTAILLTAGCLTIPANALPVMEMVRFGRPETDTIYSGVVKLVQHDLWGLAIIIFVASIVIPLFKVVVLGLLLWTTAQGKKGYLVLRTRAFRWVHYVGRWSMVDVFAVTVLVSIVHMGRLASVLPRYGAVAFCAVVILTMLATDAFDPRLMWDAAGMNGPDRQVRER